MFAAGGGGGVSLPTAGSPAEVLILLLVLAGVVWLTLKLFSL